MAQHINRHIDDVNANGSTPTSTLLPYRSTFYSIIGPAPALAPGDHSGAQSYLDLISLAIKKQSWSGEGQRVRLWGLRKKWKKRAEGKDAWFEAYGTRVIRKEVLEQVTRKTRKEIEEEGRAKAILAMVKGEIEEQKVEAEKMEKMDEH